jgi:hypothetical protein
LTESESLGLLPGHPVNAKLNASTTAKPAFTGKPKYPHLFIESLLLLYKPFALSRPKTGKNHNRHFPPQRGKW